MDYSKIRPSIVSGDVLAFSHESSETFYDKKVQLVRFATKSLFAHVAIAWVVGNRVFALEAVTPFPRIYPLSKMGNFYHLPINKPLSTTAEEVALSLIGKDYEYSEWEAVLGFFGRNILGNSSIQCCEFVQIVLQANKYPLPGRAVPSIVVEDLMNLGIPCIKVLNEAKP